MFTKEEREIIEKYAFVSDANSRATKTWEKDGLFYEIVFREVLGFGNYYCGYVTIPQSTFLQREEFEDVDVHWGLTYIKLYEDCMKFGFDCAHFGDSGLSYTRDLNWLTKECERMGEQIAELI
jgi:hypothetical protein